jgi:hypothetical protein
LLKDVRKKKIEVAKKRNEKEKRKKLYGVFFSGPSNTRTAGSLQRIADAHLPRNAAQAWSQGSDLPRVGGSPSAASSGGGAVLGSATASAAPPTFSRQSPRALACVLRAPADDLAYAPPSPLLPLLFPWEPGQLPRVAGPWLRRCVSVRDCSHERSSTVQASLWFLFILLLYSEYCARSYCNFLGLV